MISTVNIFCIWVVLRDPGPNTPDFSCHIPCTFVALTHDVIWIEAMLSDFCRQKCVERFSSYAGCWHKWQIFFSHCVHVSIRLFCEAYTESKLLYITNICRFVCHNSEVQSRLTSLSYWIWNLFATETDKLILNIWRQTFCMFWCSGKVVTQQIIFSCSVIKSP